MVRTNVLHRAVALSLGLASLVVFVAFWLYVRPSAGNVVRFAPLALWNIVPFAILSIANRFLGDASRAVSFVIAISTAIILSVSLFLYGRLAVTTWTVHNSEYEPNLVWIFSPAVLLIFVIAGVVAALVARRKCANT